MFTCDRVTRSIISLFIIAKYSKVSLLRFRNFVFRVKVSLFTFDRVTRRIISLYAVDQSQGFAVYS